MTVYVVLNGYFVHRAIVDRAEGDSCAVFLENGESMLLPKNRVHVRREDAESEARRNEKNALDREGRIRTVFEVAF